MRTLGIDLGKRRVGLALSDEGGRFATPLEVLEVASAGAAIEPIAQLIRKEGVTRVVLGLPLNMDNTIGPAASWVHAWGIQLHSQADVDLIFVDERLSSFEAEQQLVNRKRQGERLTRQKKKERLDALAAASFLQAFLDGKLMPVLEVPKQ